VLVMSAPDEGDVRRQHVHRDGGAYLARTRRGEEGAAE
jgi:hypothetical protein